jgi:hypothetical protein
MDQLSALSRAVLDLSLLGRRQWLLAVKNMVDERWQRVRELGWGD